MNARIGSALTIPGDYLSRLEAASTNGLCQKGLGMLLKSRKSFQSLWPKLLHNVRLTEIHGKSFVLQGPGWLPKDKGTSRILEAGAGIRHFPCLSRGYSTVIRRMLPRIS
jgi:hypothetical protein